MDLKRACHLAFMRIYSLSALPGAPHLQNNLGKPRERHKLLRSPSRSSLSEVVLMMAGSISLLENRKLQSFDPDSNLQAGYLPAGRMLCGRAGLRAGGIKPPAQSGGARVHEGPPKTASRATPAPTT